MRVNTRYTNSTIGTSSNDVMLWGCTSHPLVEFMHLVFTCMPGESYGRWLLSLLLCLCDIFQVLINSLVPWFCTSTLGLVLLLIWKCKTHSTFNPFTVSACKIYRLKDAETCLQTVFSSGPITSTFSAKHRDESPFTCQYWKRRLKVLNFTHVLVVFKWHHRSEGVKNTSIVVAAVV